MIRVTYIYQATSTLNGFVLFLPAPLFPVADDLIHCSLCRHFVLLCHQLNALVHPTDEGRVKKEDGYLSFLSFIEAIWKAGPQLTLQVYIKLTTDKLKTLPCKNQRSTVFNIYIYIYIYIYI